MKKIIFLFPVYFYFISLAFAQQITAKIHPSSKNLYALEIKVDVNFQSLYLDWLNSYVSLVDQDSLDLGNYEIFKFDASGSILGEFYDNDPNEIKLLRMNLVFRDSLGNIGKHESRYYELYLKSQKFFLNKSNLLKRELKIYFNDNSLARAMIWNTQGQLIQILDIYSGMPEKIDFMIPGNYFLTLLGFKNSENFILAN